MRELFKALYEHCEEGFLESDPLMKLIVLKWLLRDVANALIDQGARIGVLNRREETMLEQVLNFDESRVESLLTPRNQIVWLDIEDPSEEMCVGRRHEGSR